MMLIQTMSCMLSHPPPGCHLNSCLVHFMGPEAKHSRELSSIGKIC